MTAGAEVTALDLLAEKFGDVWTIWRSDLGHWYATRRHPVTEAEGDAGCNRMVNAATPARLDEQLTEQGKRAQRAAVAVENRRRVLESTFPGWEITYLHGEWHAIRLAEITDAQAAAGVVGDFSQGTYGQFAAVLAEQSMLVDRCGGYRTP